MSILKPLIEQRADPFIYKHSDGFYYFTASVPAYDRIELRRAQTIEGLLLLKRSRYGISRIPALILSLSGLLKFISMKAPGMCILPRLPVAKLKMICSSIVCTPFAVKTKIR